MIKHALALTFLLILLAACQPEIPAAPTMIPFPTMTVGQTLRGVLTPAGAFAQNSALSNPATAIALSNRPTATPDYTACPTTGNTVTLPPLPPTITAANEALLIYLNSGGDTATLENVLRQNWAVLGETGYVRPHDIIGRGTTDVLIGYTAPGETGILSIFGCQDGRYVLRYTITADGTEAPQLLRVGDINRDFVPEIVFTRRVCEDDEACEFETQVMVWQAAQGRFINLLAEPLISLNIPTLNDIDNDEVQEVVLTLNQRGNSATGPLRTGVNIFDWNGSAYVLSIIQLDPPRYRIQIIHQADRDFLRLDMPAALQLYQLALDTPDLRDWFNDGRAVETSYALYRQLLIYAYLGDDRLNEILIRLNTDFPFAEGVTLADLPPYVEMANVFLNEFTVSANLNAACTAVQTVITQRPDAIALINRYGSRSPNYSALDLCPY
jgi:hypothetical protein